VSVKWAGLALLLLQGCHTMAPIRSARLAPEGATIHSSSAVVDNRGHLWLHWGERDGTPQYNAMTGLTHTPKASYLAAAELGPSVNGHQGVLMGMGPYWDLGMDVGGDVSLSLALRRALKRDPLEKGLAVTASVEGRSSLSSRHAALGLAATQRLGPRLDLTLGSRGGYLFALWRSADKSGLLDLAQVEGLFAETYAEAELKWGRVGWSLGGIFRWPLAEVRTSGSLSDQAVPLAGVHPWIGVTLTFRLLPRPGVPDRLVKKSGYRHHGSAETGTAQRRYELAMEGRSG
jgi:hypothetical protein